MTFSEFESLVSLNPDGIVLLEGRRSIAPADFIRAEKLAFRLAQRFPILRFRSGNAEGADEAFSRGVDAVDAKRLQVVAPYASHRKRVRYTEALYDSPDSLSSEQEETMSEKTSTASPKNKGLANRWFLTNSDYLGCHQFLADRE